MLSCHFGFPVGLVGLGCHHNLASCDSHHDLDLSSDSQSKRNARVSLTTSPTLALGHR